MVMTVAEVDIDRISPTRRPNERPAGYQRWSDLLFLHWRVSPAEIAAHVPESLSIDTFEGSAWVGVVAFRMSGVRPWWSPPVPGISAFPETNVRTYVHARGRDPGVWFLSLDAHSSLAAKLGRIKWGLPYHRSEMHVRRRGTDVRYTCERLWPGRMGAGGTIEAEIGELCGGFDRRVDLGRALPGTIEHFLIERYVLFSQKKGRLHRGQVHHSSYPLREARLSQCEQTFLADLGLHANRPPDHVIFSDGVSTEIFALRPVTPAD
jgi:uncharacterized protein